MKKHQSARQQTLARSLRDRAAKYAIPSGVTPFASTAHASKFAAFESPQRTSLESNPVPDLFVHSTSEPFLREGEKYTIHATQAVFYPGTDIADITRQNHLQAAKEFNVLGSKSSLDRSSIHSVYPPSGHADYWNTLPHVLFNNPQTPWLFASGNAQSLNTQVPWLALFVFTTSELSMSAQCRLQLADTIGRSDMAQPMTQAADLSVSMTNKEFQSMASSAAMPLGDSSSSAWNSATMNAIFVSQELFDNALKVPATQLVMSHVRTVSTGGMTDMDGLDQGEFAVTVSHRTGPSDITTNTTVYAHLIVVPGDDGTGIANFSSLGKVGVCSLFSWSYTCLPHTGFSVENTVQTLGNSIQPFRLPNTALATLIHEDATSWLKPRLMRGFSIAKYRVITGEETTCLFRGPLVPDDPYNGKNRPKDLPSSDVGTDLAIIDQESGLLDITSQLAWNLGRSMAMSDRSFSAALMRVRGTIHKQSLIDAKVKLDQQSTVHVHHPMNSVVQAMPNHQSALKGFASTSGTSNFAQRWQRAPTQSSSRALYSFVNHDTKKAYLQAHQGIAHNLAMATAADPQTIQDAIYDETNSPASTDWATVLSWVLDHWFLEGIPVQHLFPDANFIPRESMRTFYIDPDWLTAFFDGALSIAEHFTDQDEVRDAMKESIERYLHTNWAGTHYPPQLPRFGILIRSELIKKYPNIKFSAPRADKTMNQQEILRAQTIDEDLVMLLFDRVPGSGQFPEGVTMIPPAHQLNFAIGEAGSTSATSLTQYWSEVMLQHADGSFAIEKPNPSLEKSTYNKVTSGSPYGFDFQYNKLIPGHLVDGLVTSLGTLSATILNGYSSLLGSQLIRKYPTLTIADPGPNSTRSSDRSEELLLSPIGWKIEADSQQLPDNPVSNAFDGDSTTFWHTEFAPQLSGYPHTVKIDMKRRYSVAGLRYLPRQDGSHNGMIQKFSVSVGTGDSSTVVATGSDWTADATSKVAKFSPVIARYITLVAEQEVNQNPWTSAAEISIIAGSTTMPVHSIKTASRGACRTLPSGTEYDARPPSKVAPPIPQPRRLAPRTPTTAPPVISWLASVDVFFPLERQFDPSNFFGNTDPERLQGDQQSGFQVQVYNMRNRLSDPPIYRLVNPEVTNYTTDVYFDIRLDPAIANFASKRHLMEIYVQIPLTSTTAKAPLAPFPEYHPESNPQAPSQLTGDHTDAPHKNKVNGLKIPVVESTGMGHRYTVKKQIDTQGDLYITLTPRVRNESGYSDEAASILNNPDASFVIRGVSLTDMNIFADNDWHGLYSDNAFCIFVKENYNVTENGKSDFITTKVYCPMWRMGVTEVLKIR